MPWRVEILDATVASEIDALPADVRASLARIVERIETVGLERLGEPHVTPRHLIEVALARAKAVR